MMLAKLEWTIRTAFEEDAALNGRDGRTIDPAVVRERERERERVRAAARSEAEARPAAPEVANGGDAQQAAVSLRVASTPGGVEMSLPLIESTEGSWQSDHQQDAVGRGRSSSSARV